MGVAWVGGGGGPFQSTPLAACLIVTEFPAGVTLKNIRRKRAEMFGKHLADQYSGASCDRPDCVLRDPAKSVPVRERLLFEHTDSRIDLIGILLATARQRISERWVGREKKRGRGRRRAVGWGWGQGRLRAIPAEAPPQSD